jgi:hypothetical protein
VRRVLFDSDVVLDVLMAREPHVAASAEALDTVTLGEVDNALTHSPLGWVQRSTL